MSNHLRAWVRYDGTGRIVTGGPIMSLNKPKVGNWKEIPTVEKDIITFNDSILDDGMYLSTEEGFYLIEQDDTQHFLIEE